MIRRFSLLLLASLAGCGYSVREDMGHQRKSSGELPVVAVIPFDNLSFRRGLEIRLTRLIDDEVRARSPRAPESAKDADWLLKGTITSAGERVYSEDTGDRIRESSFLITVEVTLQERSTEKSIGTNAFTTREPFSDRAGRVRTLAQAEEEALRDLAETIVYWLEGRSAKETS